MCKLQALLGDGYETTGNMEVIGKPMCWFYARELEHV